MKADWQRAGGVFIHHTSTRSSLEELKALIDPPPVPVASEPPVPVASDSAQPAPEADEANAS